MLGVYMHRLLTGAFAIVAVIAIVVACISQSRYKSQQRKLDNQAATIAALVDAADSQGRVNDAFLRAMKSIAARQRASTARSLAGVR